MTDTRNCPTAPPPPANFSLSELDRYTDAELSDIELAEQNLSMRKTRALSLKRVIYKARNPHPELEGKQ